jgi:thiol-disulfide isomerase/thioredoxin
MHNYRHIAALTLALLAPAVARGADNLILNPRLNYKKNNMQGALIRGDHMMESVKPGVPNYIVFYAEFCYNAKRQARTTVNLYNKYKDRVHFVVIDFNYGWSADQNKLVQKYFAGNIPQIVILDRSGRPVFNYVGQTGDDMMEKWLDATLEYPQLLPVAEHPMDTPTKVVDPTATRFTPITKILKKF